MASFYLQTHLGFASYLLEMCIVLRNVGGFSLRSMDKLLLSVPLVRSEQGKEAFRFAAVVAFKNILNEADSSGWRCFNC